jgi:hypothetical protein
MGSLAEIQEAIAKLAPEDRARLREWFDAQDVEETDELLAEERRMQSGVEALNGGDPSGDLRTERRPFKPSMRPRACRVAIR